MRETRGLTKRGLRARNHRHLRFKDTVQAKSRKLTEFAETPV